MERRTPTLKSVENAFNLLRAFSLEKPSYTLMELAKILGLSKGTVHRIILTAQKCGFIEKDPETSRYQLGLKIFELGNVVADRMDLVSQARPCLRKASELTGETAYLNILDQDEALCLERIEGSNIVKALFLKTGKRMPLHIGGPKVLLASLSDEEIDRIQQVKGFARWTEFTTVDPFLLKKEMVQIREQGFVFCYEDGAIGAAAIGAPIWDVSGKVVAAITLAGGSADYVGDNLQHIIDVARNAALEVSHRIGYPVDAAKLPLSST
jgi:DNA-binding IclR family transcriptional regulator